MDEPQQRSAGRSMASYYAVLGVASHASIAEIRAAYRKLAMKWHPDRCGRDRAQEANMRFQQIQEAYQVLSDERRLEMYSAGFYDPLHGEFDAGVEDVEGFCDFVREMVWLMAQVKNEGECSMEELRRMLAEMSNGFAAPPETGAPTPPAQQRASKTASGSKRYRGEADWVASRKPRLHVSSIGVGGCSGYL